MSLNIEELKAQVAAAKTEAEKQIKEATEVAILKAQLALETNPALIKAKAHMAFIGQQTAKLEQMVKECEAIVVSMPIHNPKTRDNRVWNGAHRYTFGTQIDLMYQLASGIQYSCAEHKQLLIAHTGLNQELIEQFLKGFGMPTYYSRSNHAIVEAKPYNLAQVKDAVDIMQSVLEISVDTSELTEENFQYEFERAKSTADEALKQANEAIAEADFAL